MDEIKSRIFLNAVIMIIVSFKKTNWNLHK